MGFFLQNERYQLMLFLAINFSWKVLVIVWHDIKIKQNFLVIDAKGSIMHHFKSVQFINTGDIGNQTIQLFVTICALMGVMD